MFKAELSLPRTLVAWLLEAALVTFLGQYADAFAARFQEGHRVTTKATFYILIVALVLLFELIRLQPILSLLYFRWRSADWTGISRAFPIKPYPGTSDNKLRPEQRAMAESSLCKAAGAAAELQLLLVSGWYYIGSLKKPGILYDTLAQRSPPLKLRVLLLNPGSREAEARAKVLGLSHEEYKNGIHAVLWTLAAWKEARGLDIEVALYEEEPIWQMVMTPKELWLLCARQVPAEESPVYCLQRSGPYSLAWGLLGVWEHRWRTAQLQDLAQVLKPDWSKVRDRSAA